jgi:nucleoid DNA-binding protein
MNKGDLVQKLATQCDISKAEAEAALSALLSGISEALTNGETVSLTGFGSFTVKQRPARNGRNPATGESLTIPASAVPAFKAGKSLKDACNAE